MTREELKRHCEKQIEECERWAKHKGEEPHGKIYEEHKLILELLEQQPCEDTISRADAVKVASGYCHPSNIAKELAKLPPVQPKIKTGHWIDMECYHYYYDRGFETAELMCSRCNEIVEWDIEPSHKPYYCENCGSIMNEVEG